MAHTLIGKRVLSRGRSGAVVDISEGGDLVLVKYESTIPPFHTRAEFELIEDCHIIHTTPLTEWLTEQAKNND